MKTLLFLLSLAAYAQTIGSPGQLKGNGAPAGGLCTVVGQEYFQQDAAAGEEIHRCKTVGNWTKPTVAALQSGSPIFVTSATGTDSYSGDFSPAFTAYATSSTCGATEVCDGAEVRFRADVGNTGTACFAAATTGLACKTIKKGGKNQNLQTGDIDAGDIVALQYNRVTDVWQFKSQSSTVITGTAAGWTLLEQHTASASASLDFTTCISSLYDSYVIQIVDLKPSGSGVYIGWRVSFDGGSTYEAGAGTYTYTTNYWYTTGAVIQGGQAAGRIFTASSAISGFAVHLSGTAYLFNPAGADYKPIVTHGNSDGYGFTSNVYYNAATTAITAFQILPESGTLTSGAVRCYGVAK